MFVIGLILVALALVAAVGVFVSNDAAAPLSMFGFTADSTTVAAVFLAGIVVTVVSFIGLSLLSSGARRSRRRRKELKEARDQQAAQRKSVADLEGEKARLEEELAKGRGEQHKGTPTG
ncbi:MAG: hypothetical protein GEV03_00345 [Streptosporangiales bacterium]|nr:hypothetical protein [Streptosporangiales bacterium]